MLIRFLGTSSGEPIPRDDGCGQCVSTDSKDKRLRSSILVDKKILIDAGPDVLKQLHPNQIKVMEAVLITHEHQDHVGGIKDLMRIRRDIRIIKFQPGQHFKLLGVDFYAFKVKHSTLIPTVGVEIGNLIYLPDVSDLDWAMKYLGESKIAVIDGSVLGKNFGGHLSINEIIRQIKPLTNLKKIYFTHNGHTHKTHKEMVNLVQTLGDNRFTLAYDGLELKI